MFFAVAHVVLTVLFYVGLHDQGHGFFLSFQWPAWLITVVDALAAVLLWWGYRRGVDQPWLGLALTVAGSMLMLGRATWTIFVPVLVVITIGGAGRRVVTRGRSEVRSEPPVAEPSPHTGSEARDERRCGGTR